MAFCCSVSHADYMTDYFTALGVKAKSVHSGPTSASRRLSLQQLKDGEIDMIFSVDLFNEGVDVPEVDTVLMLRPTESPVVFLQQLGRGLRTAPGKERLTVIDFIGNHRSFLMKPRTLLNLAADGSPSTTQVLEAMASGDFGLPDGCSVSYAIETVDLLRELTRRRGIGARTLLPRLRGGERSTADGGAGMEDGDEPGRLQGNGMVRWGWQS